MLEPLILVVYLKYCSITFFLKGSLFTKYQFLHCLCFSLSSFVFSRLHSFNNILFVKILFMI